VLNDPTVEARIGGQLPTPEQDLARWKESQSLVETAAGDVWAANNWNDLPIATSLTHDQSRSTWGGGTGITVIYGVAAPVKPPRMGPVRTF
jgi:hypothetical protein